MNIQALIPKAASDKSPDIIRLCNNLVESGKPLYLNVERAEGAEVNNCYQNVEQIIKQKGGRIQYGWQLWETISDRMIEAEFHAVWVDPSGKYHDITPKAIPTDRILFLPDFVRTYTGRQIDSVRIALSDNDMIVKRLIQNSESYFEAINRGELANRHGAIAPTQEMLLLVRERQQIDAELIRSVLAISTKKQPRNEQCACGSGKKFKRCCGL